MRWEIIDNKPKPGQTRVTIKVAWLPTIVINKATNTDYAIWLEEYVLTEEYNRIAGAYDHNGAPYYGWKTVSKTIYK